MIPPKETWIEIAQTLYRAEAEIIAGLLRGQNIPVYIEPSQELPSAVFGGFGTGMRLFVPETHYEDACNLLDDDDDFSALDTPEIQL